MKTIKNVIWPLIIVLIVTALGSTSLFLIALGMHNYREDDAQRSSYFISMHFIRNDIIKGYIATSSFILATSIRTVIMAPLTRLYEKTQQQQHLLRLYYCSL